MQYLYNYQTIVRFTQTVNTHFMKLRCLPCVNYCQHIVQSEFILHPDFKKTEGKDGYGNRILVCSSLEPHDSVAYISSGIVELDDYVIPAETVEPYYYVETTKTAFSQEMKAIPFTPSADKWEMAQELSRIVNAMMFYVPGSTDMQTTAAMAFSTKQGVCQDYSHILLALCRHYGIPSRYVNGFIAGEGETHAWVEVWVEGAWRGLDPTHGIVIENGYIKLAHGRDADDCPVSRGTYTGMGLQQTEIRVIVNKL